MIPDHLAKLEEALRTSASIPESTRKELLDIVAGLKAEVSSVAAGKQPPGSAAKGAHALSSSIRQIEATHPHLVEMVNQIADTLSNMGI